jgi:hypothetical protein
MNNEQLATNNRGDPGRRGPVVRFSLFVLHCSLHRAAETNNEKRTISNEQPTFFIVRFSFFISAALCNEQ